MYHQHLRQCSPYEHWSWNRNLELQFPAAWELYKLNCFARAIGAVYFQTRCFLSSLPSPFLVPVFDSRIICYEDEQRDLLVKRKQTKNKLEREAWENKIGLYVMAQCRGKGCGNLKWAVGWDIFRLGLKGWADNAAVLHVLQLVASWNSGKLCLWVLNPLGLKGSFPNWLLRW